MSSPIHRTEEKFTANDDDDDSVEFKSAKSGARLNRLAALASTINNWEDDLSHPTLVKKKMILFHNLERNYKQLFNLFVTEN